MSALYWNLPLETAWRASIVPFSSEASFYAMLGFGGYNLWLAMLLAVMGTAVGHSFNWYAGQIFLHYYQLEKLKVSPRWYDRLSHAFHSYLFFFLLLCWVPFMNGLGFFAGFFNMRYKWFLPTVLLGEASHYIYYIVK